MAHQIWMVNYTQHANAKKATVNGFFTNVYTWYAWAFKTLHDRIQLHYLYKRMCISADGICGRKMSKCWTRVVYPLRLPGDNWPHAIIFHPHRGRLLHISYSTTALVYFRRAGKVIFQRPALRLRPGQWPLFNGKSTAGNIRFVFTRGVGY